MKYLISDGNSDWVAEDSDMTGAKAQAEGWIRGGDWDPIEHTVWIHATVTPDADGAWDGSESETVTVQLEPTEPKCTDGTHDWTEDSVYGHGGGVIITEVCENCGAERVTDTWAQDPTTGRQGLRSVSYPEQTSAS